MKKHILTSLLIVLLTSPLAQASPVLVDFNLSVDNVLGDMSVLGGIGIGDNLNGSYEYDDTATNIISGSSNSDTWYLDSLNLPSGFPALSSGMPTIKARDVGTEDEYTIMSGLSVPGAMMSDFYIKIVGDFGYEADPGNVGMGLGHLVLGLPDPSLITSITWKARGFNMQFQTLFEASGTATLAQAEASVSEPGTVVLMWLGMLGLVSMRRRAV